MTAHKARQPKEMRDLEKQSRKTLIALRDLFTRAQELGVADLGTAAEIAHDTLADRKLVPGNINVWVYVDTSKQVGDKDHLKVFADQDAARKWFGEHDREGVAFEYPVG